MDLLCPNHCHRDDRRSGVQREETDAGSAAIEPPVRGSGSLRIDAEQLARAQQPECCLEHLLGGPRPCAVGRQLVRGAQVGADSAVAKPGTGEVFRFRSERHRPPEHERQIDRIDYRQVIGGEDRRPEAGMCSAPLTEGLASACNNGPATTRDNRYCTEPPAQSAPELQLPQRGMSQISPACLVPELETPQPSANRLATWRPMSALGCSIGAR